MLKIASVVNAFTDMSIVALKIDGRSGMDALINVLMLDRSGYVIVPGGTSIDPSTITEITVVRHEVEQWGIKFGEACGLDWYVTKQEWRHE